ncbi:MAG TPA: tRNA uridine-5-carboxymethylaminomethyl(34) synthesis enzyme MnmG [Deltaproteobacteria bacterium]|nr:tRNA uridine-5-carboxymethylaminomethyl(34) synthesis enzyme MnmG [Deltaproteobacteria bacterium]
MSQRYDVVVVGGGHAGCEAAAAAARLGAQTALVTLRRAHIGRLSCNPAIGGLAKGHLVRELDALGGWMGRIADASTIQFRRLNTRKGLAVQSSRAQVDIELYPSRMAEALAGLERLEILEGEVSELQVLGDRISGVRLGDGRILSSPKVILTTGTFLAAVMHRGDARTSGGRIGDVAAHALARSLVGLGLRTGRLKTGTVPRLARDSVSWDRLEVQGDTFPEGRFSFAPPRPRLPQIACHLTYTNAAVHELIRQSLHRSPMWTGAIVGRGPRYCPSIEDKISRFPDRDRHLLFLEPEGLSSDRIYVNGLSTSLPTEIQDRMIRGIAGLEEARIVQHGYAVEYDFSDPTQLGHDLQHQDLPGLFLAGQVNGTSGYEEAAVQGFVAGVSAASGEVFHVERSRGYLGVLIDDLVTRGVGGEPYRMFTSRAEHRLLLREDNADRRLMPRGRALGLIDDVTWARFEARVEAIERAAALARATTITPTAAVIRRLEALEMGSLRKPITAADLLRRPQASWRTVWQLLDLPGFEPEVLEQVEIDLKYEGYVARAAQRAREAQRLESLQIPDPIDWHGLQGLSTEVRERLVRARPATLGQLSRLPGITPAAVHAIAAWLIQQRSTQR